MTLLTRPLGRSGLQITHSHGTWLEHGLDPSSLEGAIARMVLPANR